MTLNMRICVMTGAVMHWAWAVAQKPFDAAARQSFTREVAASHLVCPSRLQVARQSYILEVSHIHLCDWRRSLVSGQSPDRPKVFHYFQHSGWPLLTL